MRVLILGDPHVNSKVLPKDFALKYFNEALDTAVEHDCKYMVHTGDFCHGPLDRPNISPDEYSKFLAYLVTVRKEEICFLDCPIGNHDRPKWYTNDYTTAWQAVSFLFQSKKSLPILTIDFDSRGHDCKGTDYIEKQVVEKLSSVKKARMYDNALVIGHVHWKGNRFNMLSLPIHENFLTEKLYHRIKHELGQKGYKSVTFILGHDHTPKDFNDVGVYVIGSPTAFTFGDTDERRFLIFDLFDGSLIQVPIVNSLKLYTAKSKDDLRKIKDPKKERVKLLFEPDKKTVQTLEQNKIDFIVRPKELDYKYHGNYTDFGTSYKEYEKRPKIRRYNLERLAEKKNDLK